MRRIVYLAAQALVSTGALAAANLPWDLTYRSVMQAHPMGPTEFLSAWVAEHPVRPIHQKLTAYVGSPIEASLLLERPDFHAGDPDALWIVKTRGTAMVCEVRSKRVDKPCNAVDPQRAEQTIRQIAAMAPVTRIDVPGPEMGKAADGSPIVMNYVGFISSYVDGKATQRPMALLESDDAALQPALLAQPEATRVGRAVARLVLSEDAYRQHEAAFEQARLQQQARNAILTGDAKAGRPPPAPGSTVVARTDAQRGEDAALLAVAAGDGKFASVDRLLAQGSDINAGESAALKAAVSASDVSMVEYLLSKGASVDPPASVGRRQTPVFETALGTAVRLHKANMAVLLIQHGADVNYRQDRPALFTAVAGLDAEMVDVLLQRGAEARQLDSRGQGIMQSLMQYAGNLSGWPKEPAGQEAVLRREAVVEVLARRLAAAGADVSHTNDRGCTNALSVANDVHSEGMKKLLLELGADPEARARCYATKGYKLRP